MEGLAARITQAASPFGRFNNFYFEILSNFLGGTSARPGGLLYLTLWQWSHSILRSWKSSPYEN